MRYKRDCSRRIAALFGYGAQRAARVSAACEIGDEAYVVVRHIVVRIRRRDWQYIICHAVGDSRFETDGAPRLLNPAHYSTI